jgi:hypothetical protein
MVVAGRVFRSWTAVVALVLVLGASAQAQEGPSLVGRVTDETGGVLAGATVQVTNDAGLKKSAVSDKNGQYRVPNLPLGTFIVSVEKERFSPYANAAVSITSGENVHDVQLAISLAEDVTVEGESEGLSVDANSAAGTVVLKGEDIDALPDDPDELAEYLQALAGPAAGPNGGQLYIDGFAGSLPPKSSIREIRVGGNPFSAEYDRMGFGGRIEILTRAGTDKMRGDVSFNFNDEMFNARNPYASTRPPYQRRDWRASLSGPLKAKKASFSLSAERTDADETTSSTPPSSTRPSTSCRSATSWSRAANARRSTRAWTSPSIRTTPWPSATSTVRTIVSTPASASSASRRGRTTPPTAPIRSSSRRRR